jgi:far upstream element-binding protein
VFLLKSFTVLFLVPSFRIILLGLLIGPKGVSQKQMQERTGAKIIIRGRGASKDGGPSNTGHADDEDELHVMIEGSDEAVDKAAKEIENILFNPEEASRLKNEQLRNLAEQNGTSYSSSDSMYGPGSSGYQIELRVPNNMVGLIIGKGGENIIKIQSQLSVVIQIAKEHEMLPGDTTRSIMIKGISTNVDEAKKRIDDIIAAQNAKLSGGNSLPSNSQQSQQSRELDNAFVVKLPVPNDKVGIIIGKGGMTVKGLFELLLQWE